MRVSRHRAAIGTGTCLQQLLWRSSVADAETALRAFLLLVAARTVVAVPFPAKMLLTSTFIVWVRAVLSPQAVAGIVATSADVAGSVLGIESASVGAARRWSAAFALSTETIQACGSGAARGAASAATVVTASAGSGALRFAAAALVADFVILAALTPAGLFTAFESNTLRGLFTIAATAAAAIAATGLIIADWWATGVVVAHLVVVAAKGAVAMAQAAVTFDADLAFPGASGSATPATAVVAAFLAVALRLATGLMMANFAFRATAVLARPICRAADVLDAQIALGRARFAGVLTAAVVVAALPPRLAFRGAALAVDAFRFRVTARSIA